MKKGVRGGDPQLQRYWERMLRRWQEGGQTVRAFCSTEGLRESTFYFWRRTLAQRKEQHKEQHKEQKQQIAGKYKPVSAGKPAFLPVHLVASHGNAAASVSEATHGSVDSGVEIVLAQGCVVRVASGFDRQTLADVLSILEARPC